METATQQTVKASELRLGNLVKGNGYYKIEFIDYSTADGYEPIPLTPEILEKCGFEELVFMYDEERISTVCYRGNGLIIKLLKNGKSFIRQRHSEHRLTTHVKYLHQLQNLYFALTGTELEINL